MSVIRVLLAEDHPVVRAGLRELLSGAEDIEVVGAAEHGKEALELAESARPDVVLMDVSMPEMDGIEATRHLRERHPEVRTVILTSFSDQQGVIAALDAGAIGFLLKDVEPDELFKGIRAAAAGESPLAPTAASALLRDRRGSPSPETLTEREQEVLRLLAEGLPNKLIASELGISEKTVKTHLTSIYRRIGVDSRTEAVLWARSRQVQTS